MHRIITIYPGIADFYNFRIFQYFLMVRWIRAD